MPVGFPISDGAGNGTSAADMRQVIASHWHNMGVIRGCGVGTASSGLTYSVAAGNAVSSRSAAYGAVEFPVPASTVTTTAGPASGTRIDVVYARPLDPSQGDASTDVEVKVAQGTPSTGTPSAPSIPAGAVELRRFSVPAGMTKTSQATATGNVTYAIPYGGQLGTLLVAQYMTQGGGGDVTVGQGSFYLPTKRTIRFEMITCAISVAANVGSPLSNGSMWTTLTVDGITYRTYERALNGIAEVHYYSETWELDAGVHTAMMSLKDGISGYATYFGGGKWPGHIFKVSDEGVA